MRVRRKMQKKRSAKNARFRAGTTGVCEAQLWAFTGAQRILNDGRGRCRLSTDRLSTKKNGRICSTCDVRKNGLCSKRRTGCALSRNAKRTIIHIRGFRKRRRMLEPRCLAFKYGARKAGRRSSSIRSTTLWVSCGFTRCRFRNHTFCRNGLNC